MGKSHLLAMVVLLAGCASFHPKPISPEQMAMSFEARGLEDPLLKRFLEKRLGEIRPWPPECWDFAMLSLVALYYHPDLEVARAQWDVAKAAVITAGAIPNPSLDFSPNYDAHSPAGIAPWTIGLVFDIPFETAGKRGFRIARAEHLSAAANLNMVTIAWQVRSRLRASLLGLYAPERLENELKREFSIQEDLVKLMESRLAVGEASRPDLILVQISFDQTRLSLEEARRAKAEAQARLAQALGLPGRSLDEAAISLAFLETLSRETALGDLRRRALLNRSDILVSLKEYEASQSALLLEIARQYPDIHLGPGYGYDQGENKWTIGLSLALPVFNQNQGPIAEAEARREQAGARFIALQAQVFAEIDRALAGYSAALHKLDVADSLVSERKRQLQSMDAMFRVGEADRLSFLGAQLEVSAAVILRLNALVEAQRSLGLLEDALQYPLHSSESFFIHREGPEGRKNG